MADRPVETASLTGEPAGHEWLDEIDLDPERPWLRMGTRALGNRPWLVIDAHRAAELKLKADLRASRHDEVFAAEPGTETASRRVLDLIVAELEAGGLVTDRPPPGAETHPLDEAGLLVQEDLCLLRRDLDGWNLVAASLCFPSRWRLGPKMGHPLDAVHGPVPGYGDRLASKVDQLLDRLEARVVWRRNWFIHPDHALFQPDRPTFPEPTIPAADCLDQLVVRSERQTLRRVDDPSEATSQSADRYALFTIRIQQAPVATLAVGARRAELARFLAEAPPDIVSHRGLSPQQCTELTTALAR